jgi:hypothetical protein
MSNQNLVISLQHANKMQQTLTITPDNLNTQHPTYHNHQPHTGTLHPTHDNVYTKSYRQQTTSNIHLRCTNDNKNRRH